MDDSALESVNFFQRKRNCLEKYKLSDSMSRVEVIQQDLCGDNQSWMQQKIFQSMQSKNHLINGQEVPYGTKGSVRPDLYKAGSSIDVKNYKIETSSGRNNLARNIEKQYYQRITNLPNGTKQSVLIDIRGQNVSNTDLTSLYNDIMSRTNNGITMKFKTN